MDLARILATALCAALAVLAAPAGAREVTVVGTPMNRFARIVLTFDQATKVKVSAANSILVIGFERPVRIRREQLAGELPRYVSTVRHDPDETGLRLALVGPTKPSVLEAGERVFIDLLPPSWAGFPPSLPAEIVAELAERARAAEARLKEEAGRRKDPAKPVTVRTAELPTLTRLILAPPAGTPAEIGQDGDAVTVKLRGNLSLDLSGSRAKSASGVAAFETQASETGLVVRVVPQEGYVVRGFADEGSVLVDLARPAPPPKPSPALPPRPGAKTAAAARPDTPPPSRPAAAARAEAPAAPAAPPSPVAAKPPAAEDPPDARPPAAEPRTVRPSLAATGGATVVTFPFASPVASAAYERAGSVVLLFESADRIDLSDLPTDPASPLAEVRLIREPTFSVVRVTPREIRTPYLTPEGQAWRLSFGEGSALPADALAVRRNLNDSGHPEIVVTAFKASATRWLRDATDGSRMALVASSGRPQAVAGQRRFVDFALLQTLNGVAVEAFGDNLSVVAGQNGVVLSRPGGLAVSELGFGEPTRAEQGLAITREAWRRESSGDPMQRYRDLLSAAVEAPRAARGEARLQLARFLIVQGLHHEAASTLALARGDDSVFAARRDALMVSAIAAAGAGRLKEARQFLAADAVADTPEALVWQAAIDLRENRPQAALAGLLRGSEALAGYPDELSGPVRLAAAAAALSLGNLPRAELELAAVERMASGAVDTERHELVRARMEEAADRAEPALRTYERLTEAEARPVAAEATLRFVQLARRMNRLDEADAIRRLEILAVAWRGDEIELGAVAELARLHAAAGRWRQVFSLARRASQRFPNHDLTRQLYADTAQLFAALLLGEGPDRLSPVETLALYYDFREFAPIGRKGDEIVRRLADRLVELDLLPQAADLLQHQVDRRLTGTARASVAARLAAIRLMNNEPTKALAVLHATRLAELPSAIRRTRLLLEARGLADLSRVDLALEVAEGEEEPEFHRLRSWIQFEAGRWRDAGESGEALLGLRWKDDRALDDRERTDVLRAAIAYVLAEERVGLDRLVSKFGPKMADSPQAKAFEFVTRAGSGATREFRELAQEVSRADGLRELLKDWAASSADLAPGAEPEPAAPGDASAAAPPKAG